MTKPLLTAEGLRGELRGAAQDVFHGVLNEFTSFIRQDIREEIKCCLLTSRVAAKTDFSLREVARDMTILKEELSAPVAMAHRESGTAWQTNAIAIENGQPREIGTAWHSNTIAIQSGPSGEMAIARPSSQSGVLRPSTAAGRPRVAAAAAAAAAAASAAAAAAAAAAAPLTGVRPLPVPQPVEDSMQLPCMVDAESDPEIEVVRPSILEANSAWVVGEACAGPTAGPTVSFVRTVPGTACLEMPSSTTCADVADLPSLTSCFRPSEGGDQSRLTRIPCSPKKSISPIIEDKKERSRSLYSTVSTGSYMPNFFNKRPSTMSAKLASKKGSIIMADSSKVKTAQDAKYLRSRSEYMVDMLKHDHDDDDEGTSQTETNLALCFDWGMTITILVNGIFMGIQTDYMARNRSDKLPVIFDIFELIFCGIFTFELAVKLWKFRLRFFYMPEWRWNVFDLILVILQIVEVVSMLVSWGAQEPEASDEEQTTAGANFSFLRLLRILRFFRTLRLIRLLEFFSELKLIVSSVVKSLRSLIWTMVLLGLMIYVVGIVFTQTVAQHRISVDLDDRAERELEMWWGTLPRSILSLYEAILGGVDWDDVVAPLSNHISFLLAILFALYIAFATLAMMNVITSIFVESALKNAEKEKEEDFERTARTIFNITDIDDSGEITKDEYFQQIKNPDFKSYVRSMGINDSETHFLFSVLDTNDDHHINAEEMIKGLVHLRANAKFMDIMSLKHDLELQSLSWQSGMKTMGENLKKISVLLARMSENQGLGSVRQSLELREPSMLHPHGFGPDGIMPKRVQR